MSDKPFDGKTLFHVTIETDIVVLAENRAKAERLARDKWSRISDDIDPDATATNGWITINGKRRWALPADWEDAEPYGDKDGKTCRQIIAAIEEYERMHPTAADLEAAGQQVLEGCK